MTWGPLDQEHEEAMWYAAIMRDGAHADDDRTTPRDCPPGYRLHRSNAVVICDRCGDPVRPHDGYRLDDTATGAHRACPGA